MQFGYIVHLQLFYKKIQNIDTFIKNEFVQRSCINRFGKYKLDLDRKPQDILYEFSI